MKFFIRTAVHDEKEVLREQYIQFERGAGFRPKPGCGDIACGSFCSGGIYGRTEYEPEDLAEFDNIKAAVKAGPATNTQQAAAVKPEAGPSGEPAGAN